MFLFKRKSDKCIAFRCELDGLAIKEMNDTTYCSQNDWMHACGHDGHIAAMLVLIEYLQTHQDQLVCSVLFVFQPAEESGAGAQRLIEKGLFEKYSIKAMIGAHVMPDIAADKIACHVGALMAKSCEFTLTLKGKSAHAANYYDGLDCILGMQVLTSMIALQQQNPTFSLLHIGKQQAGEIRNGVADGCVSEGTLRSFDEQSFQAMKQNLMTCCHVMSLLGYQCGIQFSSGYECVINDENLVQDLMDVCQEDYLQTKPRLLSEDFSFYSQIVPSLFYFCGIQQIPQVDLHASNFDFDEFDLCKIIEVNIRLLEHWHLLQTQ